MTRILLSIFLLFPLYLFCQDAVPSGFPQSGDTIKLVYTQYEGSLDDYFDRDRSLWNFISLDAPYVSEIYYQDVIDGLYSDGYEEADLVGIMPDGEERYYKKSGKNILELGRVDALGQQKIYYETKPIIKRVGVKLGKQYSDRGIFWISVESSDIFNSDQYNDRTPGLQDSIKIKVSIISQSSIDQKGDLLLPQANFKVLRQKDVVSSEISVYKKSNLGWIELDEIPPTVYSMVNNYVSDLNYTKYRFWAAELSTPVLSIIDSGDKYLDIEYKIESTSRSTNNVNGRKKEIIAYPNPTFGDINFLLNNHPSGKYELRISSILGKLIKKEFFDVGEDGKISTYVGYLSRGIYRYSIYNSRGEKLVTKRISIVNP